MTRQRLSRRRLRVCLYAVIGVFALFSARLFQIQALDSQAYAAEAVAAGTARIPIPAPRGQILDRDGKALASSVEGRNITADPKLTAQYAPQIAAILRDTLGPEQIDYFATIDKLRTPNSRFVYVAKYVPVWQAKKALDALHDYPGVLVEKVGLRNYPGGRLAANLLGFVDSEGVGKAGLESSQNQRLTGTSGETTYEVSPNGLRIPMADTTVKEMVPGSDVVSTIDRDLQWYADQRLAQGIAEAKSDWGVAITMDVRTGQIIQLSQAPSYDIDNGHDRDRFNTIDRAVEQTFEPGSVMKTITMAALADQGKIRPESPIVVPRGMRIDRFHIGDYWQHGVLHLTAAGVIAKSSNLGTIVAASQLSRQRHWEYLRRFGFGAPTSIELPGQANGLLKPANEWTKARHATVSFGQGIGVTPIQMIRAVGAIANGGVMVEPTVIDGYIRPDGKRVEPERPAPRRVISPEAAAMVTRMMEQVPRTDGGTAPKAQIAGYRVAGKTGTAWRVDENGRYVRGQNTVSFMGFAPADKPRFITYVVLDRAFKNAGGGLNAAPVFQDIMSMALERFGVVPSGSHSPKVDLVW